jgi:hypothetical protein
MAVVSLDAAEAVDTKEWTPPRRRSQYLRVELLMSVGLIDNDERGNNVTKFPRRELLVFLVSVLVERDIPVPTARIFTVRSGAMKCGGVTGMPW